MFRGLTARLLLVGGLACLLCAGTLAVVLSLASEAREASASVRASTSRLAAVNRVLALVAEVESRLGTAAAPGERSVAAIRGGLAALPGAERDLLAAAAGDPAQAAAARDVGAAGTRYRQARAQQLDLRDPDAARRPGADDEGTRQVVRMRALANAFADRERLRAGAQRNALERSIDRATTLGVLGVLALPLLLAAAVLISTRRVRHPLQRLARAAHRVQEGDFDTRVEERGTVEAADLARSFNAMAESLAQARGERERRNAELKAQGAQLAATIGELELEQARIETFHDVVSAFTAEVELGRLGPLLLNKLRSVAGARGGALYVADPIDVHRGLALFETAALDPGTLPARFTPDAVERELVRHLLLPLASSGRPLGVVTLLDPISRDHATLQRMADAAAVALSNALSLETARHQAAVNRAVIESTHDAFVAVDADRRIVTWTPQAEALFGYTTEEAEGRLVDELLLPERWRAAYRTQHEALLATRTEARRFELPAVRRDGSRMTIEVSVSMLKVGDAWQVNGFVRDIGGRVARERAREAQRAVSQALAEAATGEDVVPRLLEALGRSLRWPVAVHWMPDPLAGGMRRAAQWRDPEHRGEPLPVSVSVPISDGPTGFGAFEFWQRRRGPLDPELSEALEAISELVAEVLERRRAEAETETLKNEFFALVSHELRTPLTSIIGYLELVLEEEAGAVPDEQRPLLHIIERNARRLQRLVGDLLFVAQVEAGTLSLEKRDVDLEAVVLQAVEAAQPRAEHAGVTLRAETAHVPTLDGDADRLAQVVDNLVANAVKFTPAGGAVTVRAGRRGDSAFIAVSDTGVGIAADEQDRLFERFFRTQAATEASVPGIGLGLSIVRAIARGHGGEVACESQPGVGTTFTVELPIPIHEVTRR